MDDVVDPVLNEDSVRAGNVHLNGEPCFALDSVCGVPDAVILPQNAGPAHCASDDGDVLVFLGFAAKGEVVGPVLSGDGISETDERAVLLLSEAIHCIQKIEPVGLPGKLGGEHCLIRVISVGVETVGERSFHKDSCIQLGKSLQIHAHCDLIAPLPGEEDRVALQFRLPGFQTYDIGTVNCDLLKC